MSSRLSTGVSRVCYRCVTTAKHTITSLLSFMQALAALASKSIVQQSLSPGLQVLVFFNVGNENFFPSWNRLLCQDNAFGRHILVPLKGMSVRAAAVIQATLKGIERCSFANIVGPIQDIQQGLCTLRSAFVTHQRLRGMKRKKRERN
jgi:hypothetical protein